MKSFGYLFELCHLFDHLRCRTLALRCDLCERFVFVFLLVRVVKLYAMIHPGCLLLHCFLVSPAAGVVRHLCLGAAVWLPGQCAFLVLVM